MTKKVIIVEDDMDLLETLSIVLEEEGHKVWKYDKAENAFEKLEEVIPDTMVVDLMLPGMSGDELADYVKKRDTLKGTKVILISADEKVTEKAKRVNADAHLKKPFSFEKLLTLI